MSECIWIDKLGAHNQYRGVEYVDFCDQCTMCKLCETGWMTKSCRKQHFNGGRHASKHRQVKRLGFEKRTNFQKRVQRLRLLHWRSSVLQLVYECHFLRTVSEESVIVLLEKYERMERLSLLELAIWKARVCDGILFKSLDELKEYQVLDQDFDLAAYLQKIRVLSGSEFIIPLVLGFI